MKLEADNIELYLGGKPILYGIYIKVQVGEITGILGKNGSGKSCLMNVLFGHMTPKYRTIRINGGHLGKRFYKTGHVAYLPQHKLLPDSLGVKKSFTFFNANWKEFILHFPTFSEQAYNSASTLSLGERRILETFLVLSSQKKFIFLDEPFSFIAPVYVDLLKNLIKEKAKTSGILIADHYYRDFLEISHTLFFLKNGSSKIIKSTEDLVREGYLSHD